MKQNLGLMILFILLVACSPAPAEPTATATPLPSPTPPPSTTPPQPSATPAPAATPWPTLLDERGFENCVRWDTITAEHINQEMCVYGIASAVSGERNVYENGVLQEASGNYHVHFSEETNELSAHFRVASFSYYYEGVKTGDCVAVIGIVRSYGPAAYLYIDPAASYYDGELFAWSRADFCP
ncbi:MAG: hypothetical protein KIS88_04620 [Anaerolineales bacterium]|nr:hypothetical protein [Anaerolineales bacterium]